MRKVSPQVSHWWVWVPSSWMGEGAMVALVGQNPLEVIRVLIHGAFGTERGLSYTLYYTTTFIFTGLAVSVAFHGGLFNIGGSIMAGWLGKRYPKKYLLAAIYTGRTIAAALFISLPITPTSVLVFSAVMGALWLATVSLTSGLVAHIYGIRYMGTLYGFVFLSHQLGSFLGVWLGGKMYDLDGSYTAVWWFGVGIGVFSAIVHLPIREKQLVPQAA